MLLYPEKLLCAMNSSECRGTGLLKVLWVRVECSTLNETFILSLRLRNATWQKVGRKECKSQREEEELWRFFLWAELVADYLPAAMAAYNGPTQDSAYQQSVTVEFKGLYPFPKNYWLLVNPREGQSLSSVVYPLRGHQAPAIVPNPCLHR